MQRTFNVPSSAHSPFQSSPGREAGCNAATRRCSSCPGSFNPHPAVKPGATMAVLGTFGQSFISFQSSPGREAGCNSPEDEAAAPPRWFQSSPGREAGCNTCSTNADAIRSGFQSSPGREAGCNSGSAASGDSVRSFQSSPGREAGCNRGRRDAHPLPPVSILTRP